MATFVPVSEGPRRTASPTSDLGKVEASVREWTRDAALAIRTLQKAVATPVTAGAAVPVSAAAGVAQPSLPSPPAPPIDPNLTAIANLIGSGFLKKLPTGSWAFDTTVITTSNLLQNLSGVLTSTLADGMILVGNSAGLAAAIAVSGDALLADTGVLTLASVITAAGPIGGAATVPVLTYDAKGRLTTVTTASITPASIGAEPAIAAGTNLQY